MHIFSKDYLLLSSRLPHKWVKMVLSMSGPPLVKPNCLTNARTSFFQLKAYFLLHLARSKVGGEEAARTDLKYWLASSTHTSNLGISGLKNRPLNSGHKVPFWDVEGEGGQRGARWPEN